MSFRHQTVSRLPSQRREKGLSESVPSLHEALVEWRNKHFIIYYFFFFFFENMCTALELTWSLRDYTLLPCDYMLENSTTHIWGLGIL